MRAQALVLTASSLARYLSIHQTTPNDAPNQTIIYLALGALLGVAYSLGTEKFMRAMQHRHIFVRNAMLWLSAIFWLFAAGTVIWIAFLIYQQSGGGLEGFDRVLGVLIPFVVRADLVVDWAKRVAWALLNMTTWTQSAVQVRRMLGRADSMDGVVDVDDDVLAMAPVNNTREGDLLSSEDRVWVEDTDSLLRFTDVLQHFEKLGRVAFYAIGGLFGAVPAAIVWIIYAAYNGGVSLYNGQRVLAVLYWLSLFLTPLGAVIMILASTVLLCGVVALSVVGTVIQFSVYWSTRTVYSMVRIGLSQAWAGFPGITKPRTMPNVQQSPPGPNAGNFVVKAIRHPEEAGAAIAQVGILLPTELEFSLASWDGFHQSDLVQPDWFTTRLFNMTFFKDSDSVLARDMESKSKQQEVCEERKEPKKKVRERRRSRTEFHYDPNDVEVVYDVEKANLETVANRDDPSTQEPERSTADRPTVVKDKETVLVLLGRLGLDLSVKSARKRRLSTYYALGMLVQLQLDSGGNAWRLQKIEELSDEAFRKRIDAFNSIIADEANIAVSELSMRLRRTSKYRIIPSGASGQQMVPVTMWLRCALLAFLETSAESDGPKRIRDVVSL